MPKIVAVLFPHQHVGLQETRHPPVAVFNNQQVAQAPVRNRDISAMQRSYLDSEAAANSRFMFLKSGSMWVMRLIKSAKNTTSTI